MAELVETRIILMLAIAVLAILDIVVKLTTMNANFETILAFMEIVLEDLIHSNAIVILDMEGTCVIDPSMSVWPILVKTGGLVSIVPTGINADVYPALGAKIANITRMIAWRTLVSMANASMASTDIR